MEWTGERMLADEIMGLGATEHLHRYAVAATFAKEKVVLDIASGEGYGTSLLSFYATKVYGVDISSEAIAHAKKKYKNNNLEFLAGNVTAIPLADNSIDCIVSFETIEHIDRQNEMMAEFKRVLKDDGIVIISTPAKEMYEQLHYDNPFHVKEITSEEFFRLISSYFSYYKVLRQRYVEASFMYPLNSVIETVDEFKGDFNAIEKKDFFNHYYYNIAICSSYPTQLPALAASFFDGIQINAIRNKKTMERATEKIQNTYLKSRSYKIGSKIVKPFAFLRQFFRK